MSSTMKRLRFISMIVLGFVLLAGAAAAWAFVPGTCPQCSAVVPAEALYCPECGHATDVPGVYCWRCGQRVTAKSVFCSHCGSRVATAREEETSRSQKTTGPAPPPARAVAANGDSVLRAEQPAARPRTRPELRLTTDTTVFPPRLFSFPTGEILPSLAAHASSGWTFGFSDEKRASRWALSAGLGGIGEITLTSATITHIADPESDALAGFRIKIPTTWLGDKAGEQLFVALNLAATGQNSFSSGNFIATDGAAVEYLTYRYHETTLGTAVTWKHDKVRLHGLLHVTDFRADHLTYRADHVNQGGGEQKLVYPNFGAGVEYEANPKTHLLWEIRTIPEVMFSGPSSDRLRITNQWQTTAGLRFFPAPLLGMDAFVGVDEDAKGLADLDIGFGLHFVVAPSLTPAR